ncbi:MAG: type II/IV secretion system ATPase subunit, partial [Methanogenium sp.]|nr:type II/IV secretion system ATPase subunit [Methanogenium sp.]
MGFIDRFKRGLRKDEGGVDDNTVHNDITGDFPDKDNNRGDRVTGISTTPVTETEIETETGTEFIPKPGSGPVDSIPDESSVQKNPENTLMDNEIAASTSDSEEQSGENVQEIKSTVTHVTGISITPVTDTEIGTEIGTEFIIKTGSQITDTSGKTNKIKGLFPGLFSKKEVVPEIYDPEIHGILVTPKPPEGYEVVEEYWIDKGLSKILIAKNSKNNINEYLVYEPVLSEFEYELLERLYDDLRDVLILTYEELGENKKYVLFEKIQGLINEYGITIDGGVKYKIEYYILRNFLGWSRLDPIMKDQHIEDISCDGSEIPIFLYHRKYQNIKSNVVFDEITLNSFGITLAQRSGKHISVSSPILDATLPGGSRLQLTFGTTV